MDLWDWVHERQDSLHEAGEHELSSLISRFPGVVCDDRLDEAEEMFQQALPKCRALEDKWLEIFFRHWRLQGHVLRNRDAKGWLQEAVSLLDFTHQDDTKDCPQRICAVQDLAACYGVKDGKGFLNERVSVADETLAQIDGSWSCYSCIMGEKIEAFLDSEKFEEAGQAFDTAEIELQKHGESVTTELAEARTNYLRKVGRLDEALKVIKKAPDWGGGEHFRRTKKLLKALIRSQQGKDKKALKSCPSFEDAQLATSHLIYWSEAQLMFLKKGQIENSRLLRKQMHQIAIAYRDKGSMRTCFEQCADVINLCLDANEPFRGWRIYDLMEEVLPELHQDLGAAETAAKLKVKLNLLEASIEPTDLSDTPLPSEFKTEAAEIKALEEARQTAPNDPHILLRLCKLWQDCFDDEQAFAVLKSAYDQVPSDKPQPFEDAYGRAFAKRQGLNDYLEVFALSQADAMDDDSLAKRCALYIEFFETAQPEHAIAACQAWLKRLPDSVEPMSVLRRIYLKQGDSANAHAITVQWAALQSDEIEAAKRLIETATLVEDTAMVCALASTLGLVVDDSGHFKDQQPGELMVRVEVEPDDVRFLTAIKISPARAFVIACWHLDDCTIYGREYAIKTEAIAPKDLDNPYLAGHQDKDGNPVQFHQAIGLIQNPQYLHFELNGGRPSPEQLSALIQAIEEAGGIYDRYNQVLDTLFVPIEGEKDEHGYPAFKEEDGIYANILATQETDLGKIVSIINEHNATARIPLLSPALAKAVGDEAMEAEHQKLWDYYELY